MVTEVAMCLCQVTLILIVQHQGYITEVWRAFAPSSGCPPPYIEVAYNPSLGSTGPLTSSLHGWLKTVQTFLVSKKYSTCGLILFIALKLVKHQKCYTIYIVKVYVRSDIYSQFFS